MASNVKECITEIKKEKSTQNVYFFSSFDCSLEFLFLGPIQDSSFFSADKSLNLHLEKNEMITKNIKSIGNPSGLEKHF